MQCLIDALKNKSCKFIIRKELRTLLRCSFLLDLDSFDSVCNMVRMIDRKTARGYNMTLNALFNEVKKERLKFMQETSERTFDEHNRKLDVQKAVIAFLKAWKRRNFKTMLAHCQITWKSHSANSESYLQNCFGIHRINNQSDVRIIFVNGIQAVAIAHFEVDLYNARSRTTQRRKLSARVICEAAEYQPDNTGTWGVNPDSLLNSLAKF